MPACLPAGITSENVAEKFGITREQQDKLAARSHNRAAAATKAGKFKAEIVPVTTTWKDPKSGEEKEITVTADDGFREGATAGALGKLPAVFKKGGSTTAGNSSQVPALTSSKSVTLSCCTLFVLVCPSLFCLVLSYPISFCHSCMCFLQAIHCSLAACSILVTSCEVTQLRCRCFALVGRELLIMQSVCFMGLFDVRPPLYVHPLHSPTLTEHGLHTPPAQVPTHRLSSPHYRCGAQVSDGASAVLLMTRAEAQKRGLPILGIFRSFSAVGVPPAIMGIGPAVAIPDAVARAGLTLDDIDVFELNEAFASQVRHLPCMSLSGGVFCKCGHGAQPSAAAGFMSSQPSSLASWPCLLRVRLGLLPNRGLRSLVTVDCVRRPPTALKSWAWTARKSTPMVAPLPLGTPWVALAPS